MRRLLILSWLTLGAVGLALGRNEHGGDKQGLNDNKWHHHEAPEINPGRAISALALLSGGLLIVRRKK
jgi:hypothetical protein